MKQILQHLNDGKTVVEEVPVPAVRRGTVLVRTAASLVSAGTERMVVDFAGKNLIGKAAARPDLVRQVISKAMREGVIPSIEAAFNKLDQPMPLGYSSAGTVVDVGEDIAEFKTGDRVTWRGGGYAVHAEYAVVPRRSTCWPGCRNPWISNPRHSPPWAVLSRCTASPCSTTARRERLRGRAGFAGGSRPRRSRAQLAAMFSGLTSVRNG